MTDKLQSLAEMCEADAEEYLKIEGFKPGTKICIGTVTAGDMIEWSESNEGEAKKTANLRLIIASVRESEGSPKRMLTSEHLAMLRTKKYGTIKRIVDEIIKLNGMLDKADAAEKKG